MLGDGAMGEGEADGEGDGDGEGAGLVLGDGGGFVYWSGGGVAGLARVMAHRCWPVPSSLAYSCRESTAQSGDAPK